MPRITIEPLNGDAWRRPTPGRPRSRPQTPRPPSSPHKDDLADAEWLYAWSLDALRPTGGQVVLRAVAPG
jgi:hypothetical protein